MRKMKNTPSSRTFLYTLLSICAGRISFCMYQSVPREYVHISSGTEENESAPSRAHNN
jgi:hypothetical protein